MDLKTIRALTKLMQEYDLVDLEIESSDLKVKLSKAKETVVQAAPVAQMAAPIAAPVADAAPAVSAEDAALAACSEVTSPIPGTYYSKPNPDADSFVKVGDSVSEGQVLCLVEAMKVFNEIKAEKAGVIKKVCVDDGQAVEFGTPLFLVG